MKLRLAFLAWVPLVAVAQTEIRQPVRVDGFVLENGHATLVGEQPAILFAEGRPEIPVVRQFIDGDVDIKVFPARSAETSSLRAALAPNLPPVPRLPGARQLAVRDEAAYRSADFYPATAFSVVKVGTINDVPRWMVTLHPLRYRASDNTIEFRDSFDLRITRREMPMPPPRTPILALVVPKRFENSAALAALEADKQALGYRVVRVPAGTPKEMRDALVKLYRTIGVVVLQVLLVGDHADVPGYVTPLVSGASDHYYRCLDNPDYDADIGTPDVPVGRLAVETEEELRIVVDKIIRHEKLAYTDKSWFKRQANIATDDPTEINWKMAEGTLEYAIEAYLVKGGIFGTFPVSPTPGGDKLYAITHKAKGTDVFDALNAGRALVNYQGHGGTGEWIGPEFTQSDVRRLNHPEALPLVVSMACYTGNFTVDSFAETWLRSPKGGLLFWGSVDALYWDKADDLIGRAMYDALYKWNRKQVGWVFHHSLAEGWKYLGGEGKSKYYWETHVILGDPSLGFLEPSPKVVPR